MDEVRNPFAPGAGSPPPEFVGREPVLRNADIAIQRSIQGRPARSMMMLGLRGTGKTVLLMRIVEMAEQHNAYPLLIEAPESGKLPALLYPRLQQILRKTSFRDNAREGVQSALKALRSFASAFKLEHEGYTLSVDPEPGVADSGDLETDLPELLLAVGKAVQAVGASLILCIDEVQYLTAKELAALITALHRCNQKRMPVVAMLAGLPQVAGLSGDAKSYSERLFAFHDIGPLGADEAARAVREPIQDEGERITDAAVAEILAHSEGYPFFLQEWGYQSWNVADGSPIEAVDVTTATVRALERLDEGFFRVRMDRLTPKERDYVRAMATLSGPGPYRSGDVADALGEPVQRLGPRRKAIIDKGMIYSPAHGDIAFTVPMFADYLKRLESGASPH